MYRVSRVAVVAATALTLMTSLAGASGAHARTRTETYESPSYGVTLEYDARTWYVANDLAADENGGRDYFELRADDIPAVFILETFSDGSDADGCLETMVADGLDGVDDYAVMEDRRGDPIENSSRGTAYAAYTYVEEDMELAAYFECRELPDEVGVIGATLFTSEDAYADATDAIEPILESIDDSNASAPDDAANQAGDVATFTSPMYDFTVEYDAAFWTIEDTIRDGEFEKTVFSNEDGPVMQLMVMLAEDSAPSTYIDYFADSLADKADSHMEPYIDPATDETIDVSNQRDAKRLLIFETEDGETFVVYLHAQMSDDGRYVVMLAAVAPESEYGLLQDEAMHVMDSIEY